MRDHEFHFFRKNDFFPESSVHSFQHFLIQIHKVLWDLWNIFAVHPFHLKMPIMLFSHHFFGGFVHIKIVFPNLKRFFPDACSKNLPNKEAPGKKKHVFTWLLDDHLEGFWFEEHLDSSVTFWPKGTKRFWLGFTTLLDGVHRSEKRCQKKHHTRMSAPFFLLMSTSTNPAQSTWWGTHKKVSGSRGEWGLHQTRSRGFSQKKSTDSVVRSQFFYNETESSQTLAVPNLKWLNICVCIYYVL